MPPTESPPRWRQLIILLTANGVAWTGSRLAGIAIPWFVLTTTGSAVQTGVVVAAQMGPYVVAQALSGPLIDRIGPRKISVISDLVVAFGIALIPLLHGFGVLSFPLLLVILAIVGTADGPANAAKSIFIPEVAARAAVPLERVTGLVSIAERTATVVGPAIAGLVVAAWGAAPSLWLTAALSLAGAATVAFGMPRPAPREPDSLGYVDQLRDGARYLKNDRLLFSIYGMIAITNMIDTAVFGVLLPVWALETGRGPAVIGLLASVLGASSIISGLVASAYGHRFPRRATYLLGFLIGGVPRFIVLAMAVPFGMVVTVYAVAGLAGGFLNPMLGAMVFERVPPAYFGRVRTLGGSLAWAGIPFGGVIAGFAVTAIGMAPALIVFSVVHVAAVLAPAFRPEWGEVDRSSVHRDGETDEPAGETT